MHTSHILSVHPYHQTSTYCTPTTRSLHTSPPAEHTSTSYTPLTLPPHHKYTVPLPPSYLSCLMTFIWWGRDLCGRWCFCGPDMWLGGRRCAATGATEVNTCSLFTVVVIMMTSCWCKVYSDMHYFWADFGSFTNWCSWIGLVFVSNLGSGTAVCMVGGTGAGVGASVRQQDAYSSLLVFTEATAVCVALLPLVLEVYITSEVCAGTS